MEQEWVEYRISAYRPSAECEALAKEVVDAAYVVHRALGPGFLESLYEEALSMELRERGVFFRRQVVIPVAFRGTVIGQHRLDLLVGNAVVVELKALQAVAPAVHFAQVLSYLRATDQTLGLLVNFGLPSIKAGLKRIVLAPRRELDPP